MTIISTMRDDVISHLNIGNLSFEEQNEVMARLQTNITAQINVDILSALSEEDREFLESIQGLDPSPVADFLHHKIPDLDILIEKISISVVNDFKARLKARK